MTCDGKLKKHNTKTTQSRYIKKHKNSLREREREREKEREREHNGPKYTKIDQIGSKWTK